MKNDKVARGRIVDSRGLAFRTVGRPFHYPKKYIVAEPSFHVMKGAPKTYGDVCKTDGK